MKFRFGVPASLTKGLEFFEDVNVQMTVDVFFWIAVLFARAVDISCLPTVQYVWKAILVPVAIEVVQSPVQD